jgi:polycystin 1L2
MQGPLQDGLFPDAMYNDQPIPEDRKGYVMTYNRIIGKIRMRQLRVEPGVGCKLSTAVLQKGILLDGTARRRQFVDYCYAKYSTLAASNKSFGSNVTLQKPFTGGFAYSNASENGLVSRSIQGQVSSYDGSGFVRDLDATSREGYVRAVEELKAGLWVDAQTRAVIVTLNVYNGNYNYYCISQFVIEFTEGGSVVPTATNKVLSLDMYETADFSRVNKVVLQYVPDLMTILGTIAYLMRFLYKLYRVRKVTKSFRPVLRDSWNVVDVLMLLTLGATYMLRWQYLWNEDRRSFDPFKATGYTEMSGLASAYTNMFIGDSATVMVLVVKALKYFALQKDLMLLQKTLVQAITDLVVFIAMLVVLFFGFVLMGMNIFGMQANGFKSIQDTIGTLFLILLGEFDYLEMESVHAMWAFVFFLGFVIFMFFIVLNIFLAILNDAYTVVHTDVVWDELEKRKAMSLREKFEVRKAIWRERKNIARMKKLKKQKIKDAKKAKVEYEKKQKERLFTASIARKKRQEVTAADQEYGADAVSSTKDAGARRTATSRPKPFG